MGHPKLIHEIAERIDAYHRKSRHNCIWFRSLKAAQIILASAIPLVSTFGVVFRWGTAAVPAPNDAFTWKSNAVALTDGGLAFLIVVLEGMQELFQFQHRWLSYQASWEAMDAEYFAFRTGAGEYRTISESDRETHLVDRIEAILVAGHTQRAQIKQAEVQEDEIPASKKAAST